VGTGNDGAIGKGNINACVIGCGTQYFQGHLRP
jgi:hypothetical protein